MVVVHGVTAGLQGRTGSYVLNRTPDQTISAATRKRVLRAAEELGYVPHASARTLARGRSDLILIDASGLPFGQTVGASTQALADAFADRGYTPIVDYSTGGSDSHTLLRALMQLTVAAAVIAVTPLPAELRARLDAAGIPCSERSPDPGAPGGIPQQIGDAARHQVRYLAQRGHRAIAYARAADPALGMLDGLRARVAGEEAAGLGLAITVLGPASEPTELARELRRAVDEGLTALAACNDEVAYRILGAAARARTAVPDELAVIEVDDLPPSAACWPALTTVRCSAPSLEEFTTSVEATLAGEPMPFVAIGAPELVRRESA